jgi:hypothetical protein
VPVVEVSVEQRRYAKVINFGLIYGMGAFGLAQQPGHRAEGGARLHRPLLRALCRRARYMDETKAQAKPSKGYVETAVRPPHLAARDQRRQRPAPRGAERQAINAPMQGTAADLIKLAMIAVQQTLDDERRATRMVMQVHDELVPRAGHPAVQPPRAGPGARDRRAAAGAAALRDHRLVQPGRVLRGARGRPAGGRRAARLGVHSRGPASRWPRRPTS